MTILHSHIKNNSFGHAYLLVGDFDSARESAFGVAKIILQISEKSLEQISEKGLAFSAARRARPNLEEKFAEIKSHPDFFYHKFETMGVDDAQIIRHQVSQRGLMGGSKVFVIEALAFGLEAANSLLKTLEEPYEGTHFFVITSSKENVLPTLLSRFTVVEDDKSNFILSDSDKKLYSDFMKALPNERFDLIMKTAWDKKEKKYNKNKVIEFLNGLELYLHTAIRKPCDQGSESLSGSTAKLYETLEDIQKNRAFLYAKGSSAKMVVDHLVMVLAPLEI